MIGTQHQLEYPGLPRPGVRLREPVHFRLRQVERLPRAQRIDIVQVRRRIADPVSGDVRREGESEMLVGEEGVRLLVRRMETDVLTFQDPPGFRDIARCENFADIARVGLRPRHGVEQVQTGQIVLEVLAQRLQHDEMRLLRPAAEEEDLVRVVQPRAGKPVRSHEVELFEVGKSVPVIHLHDDAAYSLKHILQPARFPPVVDLQPVLIEEIGVLLVSERLPGLRFDSHFTSP